MSNTPESESLFSVHSTEESVFLRADRDMAMRIVRAVEKLDPESKEVMVMLPDDDDPTMAKVGFALQTPEDAEYFAAKARKINQLPIE
jgi:hypothetical protein